MILPCGKRQSLENRPGTLLGERSAIALLLCDHYRGDFNIFFWWLFVLFSICRVTRAILSCSRTKQQHWPHFLGVAIFCMTVSFEPVDLHWCWWKIICQVQYSSSCILREDQAGTLSALLWRAPFWASPWTFTVEGLTSDSHIMTTSWLSPRLKKKHFLSPVTEYTVLLKTKVNQKSLLSLRPTLRTTTGCATSCTRATWQSQAARCPNLWRTLSPLKTPWQKTQVSAAA